MLIRALIFFLLLKHAALLGQPGDGPAFVKGIYGNPATLLQNGHSFKSLGVNAMFVRSISLTPELYRNARENGVRVFVEFPLLNGNNTENTRLAVNEKGEKALPADWFMGFVQRFDSETTAQTASHYPDGI
jgi:hypothetical protein